MSSLKSIALALALGGMLAIGPAPAQASGYRGGFSGGSYRGGGFPGYGLSRGFAYGGFPGGSGYRGGFYGGSSYGGGYGYRYKRFDRFGYSPYFPSYGCWPYRGYRPCW